MFSLLIGLLMFHSVNRVKTRVNYFELTGQKDGNTCTYNDNSPLPYVIIMPIILYH